MAVKLAKRQVAIVAQAAIIGTETAPGLSEAVQDHLGARLRARYQDQLNAAVPSALLDLVAAFDRADRRKKPSADAFRSELLAALPSLRGFAISLASSNQADDLIQETLLKAWRNQHRFEPGTNLKAWLFTIMRNQYYTILRSKKREVEDADGAFAAQLIQLPNQEPTLDLQDIEFTLQKLPPKQREALVLVGAQGMSYEAAASLLRCQVGTVKSRVSRARAALMDLMRMNEPQAA